MLKQDIVREATRLTRAGQLVEATVLLQRMLRGESTPDATLRTTGGIALPGREPPIIDAKPNTIEETDSPHLARATSAQPRMLRPLLDRTKERSGLGLRGVIKRAPLSTPDIVPKGARFIGRSKARLRWWTVGRSGRGCYHGSNLPRSVRGNRRTFWPRLWHRH